MSTLDRPARPHEFRVEGFPDRETAIVAALRRIVRAVDLHSQFLRERCGLTGPQLAVLRQLERADAPLTPAAVAQRVHLSRATVTGICARLERGGHIERRPSPTDRRSVELWLTESGRAVLASAPSLLQERFRRELTFLEDWEQLQVLATLERIASLMDVEHLPAAPHLVAQDDDLSEPRTESDESVHDAKRTTNHVE